MMNDRNSKNPGKVLSSESTSLDPEKELESWCLKNVPPTVFYIPDFITSEEEEDLLHHIYSAPRPKWTCLSNRRLQNWGGLPHPKGMISESLPSWLSDCANRIAKLGMFNTYLPNHVLINEYKSGQGIMPHEDGPLFYPVITTVNLGSHTVLDFYLKLGSADDTLSAHDQLDVSLARRHIFSLLLEPRSLLIVKDEMYDNYLHGIQESTCDVISENVANIHACHANVGDTLERSVRISMTIRYVPNTLKTKLLLTKRV